MSYPETIAAAEHLKSEGIASAEGLAIQGESNGGLLVAAVVNQRPDLFAAALPGVGVMDMLRFALVPAHSFKYQATDLGDRPRILRVDTRAGHGAGKPIGKALDEMADLWAFAARWTGLEVNVGFSK